MDKDTLVIAQKHLALQTIHLRKSELSIDSGYDPLAPPDDNQQETFHGVELFHVDEFAGVNEKNLGYDYKFIFVSGVRLIPLSEVGKGDPEPVRFELTASFEARYFSDIELDPEAVEAFAEKNVGFNVWPFWREFAQNTSMRAGMSPPIEIPFMYYATNAALDDSVSSEN